MRRFVLLKGAPIIAGILLLSMQTTSLADRTSFGMSIEEFRRLSPTARQEIIVTAFEHRLERSRNSYYEVMQKSNNHEYKDGEVGRLVAPLNGSRIRLWTLGDSYRMESEVGGPEVLTPELLSVTSFDSNEGVVRSTARPASNQRTYGRIDTVQDPIKQWNRYGYWLDGKHTPAGEHLIRYVVDHRSKWQIDMSMDPSKIHLTIPWQPDGYDKAQGTRWLALDPVKGFLPTAGKARWDAASRGRPRWRMEEFTVEKSQLVQDVWMPTKVTELVGGSPLGPEKVTVYQLHVARISMGNITPRDLEVGFPTGTKVVDATRGVTYLVGPNNEETNLERLVGARQLFTKVAAPSNLWRRKLVWAALISIGCVSTLLALRIRRHLWAKRRGAEAV